MVLKQPIFCCVVWQPLILIGMKSLELNLKQFRIFREFAHCVKVVGDACGILRVIPLILHGRNIARMQQRSKRLTRCRGCPGANGNLLMSCRIFCRALISINAGDLPPSHVICNPAGNDMGMTNSIQGVLAKLAKLVAPRRDSNFTCGDCERSDRCSLPPSKTCIARAAQIARGEWKAKRRAKIMIGW